jgi:hypothetical protein
MQEPGTGIVCLESNSDVVTSFANANYVASNGVCIVVRGTACTSHYIKNMLLKCQRKNKERNGFLLRANGRGAMGGKSLLLWQYKVY